MSEINLQINSKYKKFTPAFLSLISIAPAYIFYLIVLVFAWNNVEFDFDSFYYLTVIFFLLNLCSNIFF